MLVAIAPYALIVAAIAAVIAIIVVCVKHWDEIKAAVKKAWDSIKQWTEQAVSKVVAKFNEMKAKATQIFNSIKEVASNIFENIKSQIQAKIESAKVIIQNTLAFIKAIFSGDLGAAKQAALNIFDEIKNGIKTRIDNAKNLVKTGLDAIKNFFSGAKWELPKIKLPHFSISGSFSLNPPSIPKFSVSWYKLGGIFDSPTLFPYGNGSIGGLGENGAEMIAPLENNLEWLDKLAGMLSDRMGGNTPIVLNVDGKVFAETAISTINRNTRQTGKLALNLV
jgi:Flp pilus assembly pilin Flp